MNAPNRLRRRELERELVDVPTPPPPADLLDRIRGEIPADLGAGAPAPSSRVREPWHRRPLARLAAGLAVAAVGLTIALQVVRTRDQSTSARDQTERGRSATPAASDATPAKAPPSLEASASPKRVVFEPGQDTDEMLPLKGKTEVGPSAATEGSDAAPGQAPPSMEASVVPQRVVVESRQDRNEEPASKGKTEGGPSALPGASGVASGEAPLAPEVSGGRERDAGARAKESELREEVVTVTAEAPLLDARRQVGEERSRESVEQTPAARDPYSILQSTPGVVTDRITVGPRPPSAPPSTGGTAEPLDRAYGDMFFRGAGTNPFVDTAEDRLSTFALDVDTGSWTLARSYLERGALPPAEAIRVEEFVNAQRSGDPAPRRADFTLVAEGAPSPFAPAGDYRLVRFAVKGREIDVRDRRPASLTFVVDVSGSMARDDRLELVKRALHLLLDELGHEDRVALVAYGSRGRVVVRPTRDLASLREAIDALRPEGSTNAEEGLRLGYDLAGEMFRPDAANRVVLCSDGVANVGATGPESILARVGREARRGIELTTVGFGMGNYSDALMEQLADQGDGRYHYVDTLAEARRIFVDELSGTLETIAKDAKVQVEFDPATVERWRLVGYENRDVADRDFRNDRVDAGEIGAGHSAVALYEIRLAPRARPRDRVATLRLRWKSLASGAVEEAALDLHLRDLESGFRRASHDLRRAAIAAEFAEMLKGSFYARAATWHALLAEAHRLEEDRRDPRALSQVSDLTELIERAARLAGGWRGPTRDDE
jgi:Ca-activated chloride channel family protein